MSRESAGTRWWENYLVRYFLPSIAGMIIMRWLDLNVQCTITKCAPGSLIPDGKDFGTPHLIVWLLLGSLYCYIASYPILVFHATRVLDFKDRSGRATKVWINPYIGSLILALLGYISAWQNFIWLAFIAVSLFSILQIYRLHKVYAIVNKFHFKNDKYRASVAYAYLDKLSRRRGVKEEKSSYEDDDGSTIERTTSRLVDIADSYRHMREHGNTAFIFFLELSLCPIVYVALKNQGQLVDFAYVSTLLMIWIIPSALVHYLGQHLERRFSLFNE